MALACLAAASAAAQRVTVSLNFGVRTSPDTAAPPTCDTSVYNISLANQRCMGLSSLQATDPPSCAAAACTAGAQAWQWLAGQGCWAGVPDSCGPSGDAWAGAAAAAPLPGPPPPPADSPPAQPGYDDAGWQVVDTPHDATVTGAYSPSANGGEGFLPSPKTWYRKRFLAPSAWRGSAVTLVVDAALSTTTWWLNGAQIVVSNPAGYLPTVLRLDTLPAFNFSDATPNVLVAYTDGTETTGWWWVPPRGAARSAPTDDHAPRSLTPSLLTPSLLTLPAGTRAPG